MFELAVWHCSGRRGEGGHGTGCNVGACSVALQWPPGEGGHGSRYNVGTCSVALQRPPGEGGHGSRYNV